MGVALEEKRDRGETCGVDAVPSFGHRIDRRNLMKEKIRLGHRRLPIDHFTHNNQPKTGGRDGGVYEGEA